MSESNEMVVSLQPMTVTPYRDAGEHARPVLLIPDGDVRSVMGDFVLDPDGAQSAIDAFRSQGVDLVIDFEHSSVPGYEPTDKIAPAAGWIRDLWYEPAKGLFGHVAWNERAQAMLKSREYRYLSPAVVIEKETRRVIRLDSAALTHKPAIQGGLPVAASRKEPTTLTETHAMPESPNSPAELERLVGELRAILIENEVEIPGAKDRNDILRAALAALKEAFGEKSGGDGESTGAAEIAASARKRLGLGDDATKDEVLLALSLVDVEALRARESKAAESHGAEAKRRAAELLETYIAANVLNPHDLDQMAVAQSLARQDPEKFEKLVRNLRPYAMPGRTTPPERAETERGRIIASTSREFDDNPELRKLANKEAHVNVALRDEGLPYLTEDELKTL